MITFNDIRMNLDGQTEFFLPMRLRIMLTNELNRQGVDIIQSIISYREIMDSEELTDKYRPYQEEAYNAFVANGYDDVMQPQFYDMLIINVDPDYLFEKLKLFYGDKMDPDYAFRQHMFEFYYSLNSKKS